jgi:predicted MFS family arabinose efflux permease
MEVVMNKKLNLAFAIAVGVLAANLYYAQPLVAQISKALGLKPELAGLVVTLTQMGYGLGVLLIVPLGDIIENKKLTLFMVGVTIIGVLGLAYSTSLIPYFIAAFATGVGASSVQILVPYAASIVPDEKRGALVGTLMSGLMIGIMLSRPASGILTDMFTWHTVFVVSAVLMAVIGVMLWKVLPVREPTNKDMKYGKLLLSMTELYMTTAVLRRRAIYQAFLFGSFCLFWTAAPLHLAGDAFNLSATQIAIFALVGVGGAVISPYAGKASDKGWVYGATLAAMIASSLSFLLTHLFKAGSTPALIAMVVSAILLDAGVIANLVLGQREIFTLPAVYRSRLNGLYIATIFIGGATGSALGAWSFARGGWDLTTWVGFALPASALIYFLTEKRDAKVQVPA